MQNFSCGSDKYTEIKMCDLELFSKIQSQLMIAKKFILKRFLFFGHQQLSFRIVLYSFWILFLLTQ